MCMTSCSTLFIRGVSEEVEESIYITTFEVYICNVEECNRLSLCSTVFVASLLALSLSSYTSCCFLASGIARILEKGGSSIKE